LLLVPWQLGVYMTIWNDSAFMEWFEARPPNIQAFIRQYPPDKQYRVENCIYPGTIYSYGENKDGSIGFKMIIESPLRPRIVFGLKPEDIRPWD